jgi:ribosomal protein S18 acetylase RimI-like enzyme
MDTFELTYRPAAPSDAADLAVLINYAGEGLPVYLWERMAEPGETPWDVGKRRALRDNGAFSYRNAVVAEHAGEVVGSLVGYRIADEPEAIDDGVPAMFVPLIELENLVPGTWYVNVLAVRPELRGRGIGSRLLDIAGQRAAETGSAGQSIIVSDANHGARRLYERHGFRHKAERPIVKDEWDNPGHNWILLEK